MPGRGRSSFNKRQKERSRQDNQREKLERKAQRKLEKQTSPTEDAADETPDFSAVAEQWALPGSTNEE